MARIAERVARGAALLDEKDAAWWRDDAVNLDSLDLSNCRACILGQLYGCFEDAVESLNLSGAKAADLGFDRAWDESPKAWANLTATWRRVIEARRQVTP